MQVIDEVAKVFRSMRRQVPMIQEMQKDQKPEECADQFQSVRRSRERWSERHHELHKGCTTLSPYLKGRTDKAEVQKDKNVSPRDEQT